MSKDLRICTNCHKLVDFDHHDCPALKAKQLKQAKITSENDKRTSKQLTSQRWRRFRQYIILRDGGKCQRCATKLGINTFDHLEIHHIKPRINYPELLFDENNCITLCKQCNDHLALNGLDFDWEPPEHLEELDPIL